MTKQEIILNDKAKNITNDDYDAIKEAISKLSSASENQFEIIKKEKWYNRVFDMITFSKKNQKRLAEQISTVAQANQIFIELLLRLSENDKNISELVYKSLDDIKKLQNQDIYLLSLIKRLEDSALGIRKDTDIDSLSDDSKNLLCACIYYNSEKYEGSSDNQKRFYNSLCLYIKTDGVQMDNPYSAFDRLDSDSKLRIFFTCMEYFFLYDCSDDSYDKYEDEIDEFDIGNKTIKQVKQQIKTLYDARGVEGFVNKFESYNNERLMDSFFVEFDDILLSDDAIEPKRINSYNKKVLPVEIDYSANEDETISTMLSIGKGDKVVFKNKNIHLDSYIKCDGKLEFIDCVINYNEFDNGDEIQIGEDASIAFDGCMICCKGYDESVFISNIDYCNNKFSFKNSSFFDCSYFINVNNVEEAIIENCYFHNCFNRFMHISLNEDASFIMDSNYFMLDDVCDFNSIYLGQGFFSGCTIIRIESVSSDPSKEISITNLLLEESLDESSEISEKYISILDASKVKLKQSTVLNLSKDLFVRGAYNCYFKDCLIGLNGFDEYDVASEVDNCLFDTCTNIFRFQHDVSIHDSSFVSCYGGFFDGFGSLKIKKCNFYNTKFINDSAWGSVHKAFIEVGYPDSSLKECVFDGIELSNGHLIAGKGYDSSASNVCSVSGCYFLNWKKGDNDNLINEYTEYLGLFNKSKSVKSINVSSDCKGLDKSSGTGVSDKSQDEIYDMGQQIIGSNVNHEGDYSFVNRVKNV